MEEHITQFHDLVGQHLRASQARPSKPVKSKNPTDAEVQDAQKGKAAGPSESAQ